MHSYVIIMIMRVHVVLVYDDHRYLIRNRTSFRRILVPSSHKHHEVRADAGAGARTLHRPTELLARAAQPRADGSNRHVTDLRDLFVLHALKPDQQQRFSLL